MLNLGYEERYRERVAALERESKKTTAPIAGSKAGGKELYRRKIWERKF